MASRRRRDRTYEDAISVLYLNAATTPRLGADAWIHAQIFGALDRQDHVLVAACVPGPPDAPAPLFAMLRGDPGVELWPVDLGPERSRQGELGRLRALAATIPAIANIASLALLIRRRGVEVVQTSERPRDAFVGVLLGKLTGAASMVHLHVGYGEWMSPLARWAFRHADALVAVSNFVAQTFVVNGHDASRLYVVLNAVDAAQWSPGRGRDEMRAELGVPEGVAMIMTACRLFPSKGPEPLIRAFADLSDRSARLVIVGDEMVPGFRRELEELAHDLGVGSRVIFTGYRADMEALMAATDIFAMPSIGEPFGLVFAEAMAMERPVVAWRSGGAPEVVTDGISGLLCAEGDIEALRDSLDGLVADPEQRARMGAAGRRRVLEDFTPDRMATDMAAVYRAVLATAETSRAKGALHGLGVGG